VRTEIAGEGFVLSPSIVETYRNCEARDAVALRDIVRALCISHESLRVRTTEQTRIKPDSAFSDEWRRSIFVVAFRGDETASFIASNIEEAIGIVTRETNWTEWSPLDIDSWVLDGNDSPFEFRANDGECFSVSILRITGS
jgi:hypothetical protein